MKTLKYYERLQNFIFTRWFDARDTVWERRYRLLHKHICAIISQEKLK